MSAGTLHATIKLDEPGRIHCGGEDPVTGNVVLKFRPSMKSSEQQISEFFGPLKISVTFHGRLKSKIRVKRNNSSSTYRGRVQLFSKTVRIFDDSAKIASGETWPVPFQLAFPDGFESRIAGDWQEDGRFDCSQEQPLPPSFVNNYSGFANHYESFIEYRVGVNIGAPHVPVEIVKPEKHTEPLIHYQRSRLPRPLEPKYHQTKNRIAISNEFLLPEEDRPSGFRQKFKAGISSDFYPHYNFDWVLVAPQHIYLGQPIPFEVYIRPREEECTAIVVPEVRLTSFVASLVGYTVVRAEKQFFSSPEAGHDEPIKTFRGVMDDTGPFSKAKDWGKIINTPPVLESISSTFRTVNISHTHCMQLELKFQVAGKTISYDPLIKVTVLPPLMDAGTNAQASASSAAAGSSGQSMNMQRLDEALPRYDEGLPQYQEAVGDHPLSPSKDTGTGGSEVRPA